MRSRPSVPLLGVPYADRARFQRDTATMTSIGATAQESRAAQRSMVDLLVDLVARSGPTRTTRSSAG